jgi:hypothetical protein
MSFHEGSHGFDGHDGERPLAPTFFSKLERAIKEKIGAKMPAGQAYRTLLAAGVKPEEMDYSGVGPMLESVRGGVRATRSPLDSLPLKPLRGGGSESSHTPIASCPLARFPTGRCACNSCRNVCLPRGRGQRHAA